MTEVTLRGCSEATIMSFKVMHSWTNRSRLRMGRMIKERSESHNLQVHWYITTGLHWHRYTDALDRLARGRVSRTTADPGAAWVHRNRKRQSFCQEFGAVTEFWTK